MNQHGYIYRVTNRENGTTYVGQRRGEFQSWYLGSGRLIRRAIEKYGVNAFQLEFLRSAFDQKSLDLLEKHFISEARKVGPTYNIRDGGLGSTFNGFGPMKGRKHSEESRKRMSECRRGPKNPNYGKDFSGPNNPKFGTHLSEETKRKIGEKNRSYRGANHGNYGKVRSEETRRKISLAKKAAWLEKKGLKPCA